MICNWKENNVQHQTKNSKKKLTVTKRVVNGIKEYAF
jgi:hypothetical protein